MFELNDPTKYIRCGNIFLVMYGFYYLKQWSTKIICTYLSKWVVTCTSEWGCPIHNDVSGRLWYLKIWIERNIFIITEIYIISATLVTPIFWFILFGRDTPFHGSASANKLLIDYLREYNSARAIESPPQH